MTAPTPRLSINRWSCRTTPLPEFLAATRQHGVEGVGLWRQDVAEHGLAEVRRQVDEAGLTVTSLCRGGFFTAADPGDRATALEDNRRAIEEAVGLGTDVLVLVVGGLTREDKDVAAARRRVVENIADLAPHAERAGVRLAIEPMHPIFAADRGVVSTTGQALDIAEEVGSEAVGVIVDTYHVWWDPRLKSQIARAGQERRIASYQVCDFSLPFAAEPLNSRGHVGDGYVDFATITRWVTEAGYTGDIEVEIFNEEIWAAPAAQTLATMSERYLRHVAPFLQD